MNLGWVMMLMLLFVNTPDLTSTMVAAETERGVGWGRGHASMEYWCGGHPVSIREEGEREREREREARLGLPS